MLVFSCFCLFLGEGKEGAAAKEQQQKRQRKKEEREQVLDEVGVDLWSSPFLPILDRTKLDKFVLKDFGWRGKTREGGTPERNRDRS